MGKECSENDERSITISGSAKQVDTYQKKFVRYLIILKVRYARLMIYDVIEGKRGSRGQHGSQ